MIVHKMGFGMLYMLFGTVRGSSGKLVMLPFEEVNQAVHNRERRGMLATKCLLA